MVYKNEMLSKVMVIITSIVLGIVVVIILNVGAYLCDIVEDVVSDKRVEKSQIILNISREIKNNEVYFIYKDGTKEKSCCGKGFI